MSDIQDSKEWLRDMTFIIDDPNPEGGCPLYGVQLNYAEEALDIQAANYDITFNALHAKIDNQADQIDNLQNIACEMLLWTAQRTGYLPAPDCRKADDFQARLQELGVEV